MADKKKLIITGLIIIALSIFTMGLFDFLKQKPKDGQYITERAFEKNRDKQMEWTPKTMEQLRKYDVTPEKELKLEYFFYTNTAIKAEQLAAEMEKLEYSVEHGDSAGDKKLFIVTGWTTKMKMENEIVIQWTKQMCELGYKFDSEFDGWGTLPDQESDNTEK